MDPDIQAVADKLEIHELLARYARGVDTPDITNVEIDLDGDDAHVRAMFFNRMQLPGMDAPSSTGGYSFHELVRTPDG